MIDIATVASAAAMLNNTVSAVDKIYDWYRARTGQPKATLELRNNPEKEVLQYEGTSTESPRVVATYQELSGRLHEDDMVHIRSLEKRMAVAMKKWETLNEGLPLADPVERARIELNMDHIKEQDICSSLGQITDLIQKLGIDLEDHYQTVKGMCKS